MTQKLLELNETTTDQLVVIREFAAPKKLVFDALTQHKHIKKWNCPKNFVVTFSEGELKVGNTYKYGMQSESREGPEIILTGEYREIDPPDKVVYTQTAVRPDGKAGPETVIAITLEEKNGKTHMVFRHTGFPAKEWRDNALTGWNQAFDKLKSHLAEI
ncbi:MAG: SRPBCC domain-containing protein [Candidatus Thorarchaeota archaeon]